MEQTCIFFALLIVQACQSEMYANGTDYIMDSVNIPAIDDLCCDPY